MLSLIILAVQEIDLLMVSNFVVNQIEGVLPPRDTLKRFVIDELFLISRGGSWNSEFVTLIFSVNLKSLASINPIIAKIKIWQKRTNGNA